MKLQLQLVLISTRQTDAALPCWIILHTRAAPPLLLLVLLLRALLRCDNNTHSKQEKAQHLKPETHTLSLCLASTGETRIIFFDSCGIQPLNRSPFPFMLILIIVSLSDKFGRHGNFEMS